MNLISYILSTVAVVCGLWVAIWSFIDTRKRYYEDFMNRNKIDP